MFTNAVQTSPYLFAPAGIGHIPVQGKPKKIASASHINAPLFPHGLNSVQSLSSPLNPCTQDLNSNYDGSSRSTSAYSTFTDSAAPLLNKGQMVRAYPSNHADAARKDPHFNIRLPSDQLQMIINAIQPPVQDQNQPTADPAATMPPPPLPAHAMSKVAPLNDQGTVSFGQTSRTPLGPDVFSFIDRRAESRYSDISMHAGCTSFPTCTSEDADGEIFHNGNTPGAPATVVRGRKEGSSPTKRKLSRSKADRNGNAEKRRRSSRLLQHDSGYVAGSSDERDSDAAVDGECDGPAVVQSG